MYTSILLQARAFFMRILIKLAYLFTYLISDTLIDRRAR